MEPIILFLIILVVAGLVGNLLNTRPARDWRPVVVVVPAEEDPGNGCLPLIIIVLVVVIALVLLGSVEFPRVY